MKDASSLNEVQTGQSTLLAAREPTAESFAASLRSICLPEQTLPLQAPQNCLEL